MNFWKHAFWKNLIVPLGVLLILSLSYGVQIARLGYYLDDWVLLEAFKMGGMTRLIQLTFLDSRPLVFPLWMTGFLISDLNPLGWQIWSLFWRAAAIIVVWLGWRKMLPEQPVLVGMAALLLTGYPIFDQQASALTFSFHWIAFTLWALSFYLMICAAKSTRYWSIFTLIGIILFMFQVFSQEFFIGLEILRPFALWWIFRGQKKRLEKTIQHLVPWVITLGGFLFWRLLIMPSLMPDDRNIPYLISGLRDAPLRTLISLTNMTVRSLLEGLGGVWYRTIDPLTFSLGKNADFLAWLLAFALFILAVFFISRSKFSESEKENSAWLPMLLFGFVFFLGGIAPGLTIGRYLSPANLTSDRFAMAAMPGAALMITALIDWLFRTEKTKIIMLCLLISLSVGFQFRMANVYRHSWEKQERLYWQLAWRAPQVKPNTAFIGNGALAYGMGKWANASAMNLLYGDYGNAQQVDYWYLEAPTLDVDSLSQVSEFQKLQMKFVWNKQHSIVFQYEPDISACLWVVDQDDYTNPDLVPSIRETLPLSDLSRIEGIQTPQLSSLFGKEPDHEWWCYYYQIAERSAQVEDWDRVLEIWQEADSKGHQPYRSSEYMSFLLAAGMKENWDLAQDLTKQASMLTSSTSQICDQWQGIQDVQRIPSEVLEKLIYSYACTNLE